MKKKLFTIAMLAVSASLIIMSCSKTGNTTSGNVYAPVTNPKGSTTGGSTTGGGTTGGGSLTFAANGDPNGTFSGFLYDYTAVTPGAPNFMLAAAGFYTSPTAVHVNAGNPTNGTGTVTSVYFNGGKLKYTPGQGYDTTGTLTFPPALWVVNGNSTVPSFTYNCTTPVPVYTGGTSLPSLIIRSQNLVFPTTGASGYDQIQVQVSDGSKVISISEPVSATSIVFPSDSLINLSTVGSGYITVNLIKYNQQSSGGQSFLFGTIYEYYKGSVNFQ